MSKINLLNISNLQNESTAVGNLNANSAIIVAALDNTLSRDGSSPNQMNASLDMNSQKIINLPAPTTTTEPVRKAEFDAAITAGIALGGVKATTPQAQAGTDDVNYMTSLKTAQAITAQRPLATNAQGLAGTDDVTYMSPLKTANAISQATTALLPKNVTSGSSFSATFVGSGLSAQFWQNINVTASSNTAPEIGAQFGINSNTGLANTTTAYKIGLTSSALGGSGSASVYGLNTITQGWGGTYLVTGIESDVNNIGADSLSLGGASAVYGFVGVAAGTKKSTAGLWLTKSGVNAGWQLGVAVTDANSASYFENATSANGMAIAGVHSAAGIDFTGMGGTATCIIAPNNRALLSQADSGGTQRPILYIDNTNLLQFGNPNVSYINVNQSLVPNSDNVYQVGKTGNRWSSVWAANGTIQTSDPRLKTEIQPLPAGLAIVEKIEPKTYKWKDGGGNLVDVEVEEDWHVHEDEEQEITTTEIVDGKAIKTTHKVLVSVPVYDEYPLFDENGEPIMAKAAPGETPVQEVHRVPRMGKRMVTKQVAQSKPGNRTHWGFMASDIKAGFEGYGDFGGYIVDEEGTEHLRPDQLIPVLWKAVQELSERVKALEAKG